MEEHLPTMNMPEDVEALRARWATPIGQQLRERLLVALRERNGTWAELLAEWSLPHAMQGLDDLRGIPFDDEYLSDVDLSFCDISFGSFSACNLRGICLQGSRMIGTCFRGSSLGGADLIQANANNADFQSADLSAATMISGSYRRANFRSAVLRAAILDRCDLSNADLSGADCRHAEGRNTILQGIVVTPTTIGLAEFANAFTGEQDRVHDWKSDLDRVISQVANRPAASIERRARIGVRIGHLNGEYRESAMTVRSGLSDVFIN